MPIPRGVLWKRRDPEPFEADGRSDGPMKYCVSMRLRSVYDVYRNGSTCGVVLRNGRTRLRVVLLSEPQVETMDGWLPGRCSISAAADLGRGQPGEVVHPLHYEGPDGFQSAYVAMATLMIAAWRRTRHVERDGRTVWFVRGSGVV